MGHFILIDRAARCVTRELQRARYKGAKPLYFGHFRQKNGGFFRILLYEIQVLPDSFLKGQEFSCKWSPSSLNTYCIVNNRKTSCNSIWTTRFYSIIYLQREFGWSGSSKKHYHARMVFLIYDLKLIQISIN